MKKIFCLAGIAVTGWAAYVVLRKGDAKSGFEDLKQRLFLFNDPKPAAPMVTLEKVAPHGDNTEEIKEHLDWGAKGTDIKTTPDLFTEKGREEHSDWNNEPQIGWAPTMIIATSN